MRMAALCLLMLHATVVTGADPADSIRELGDGTLGFSYPAREGVRGNADRIQFSLNGSDNEHCYVKGQWDDEAEIWPGDIHAELRVRDGRVRDIEFTVLNEDGERPRVDRDLAGIDADVASAFFFDLAATAGEQVADHAVLGAVMARGVRPGPGLAAIVRDRERPGEVRESALFWMAVLAGEEAVGTAMGLIDDQDEDLELREHAVFALTQLDEDRAFPLLMNVARDHPCNEIRRSAYFWLAEYDRPEVVNLFEEILVGQ